MTYFQSLFVEYGIAPWLASALAHAAAIFVVVAICFLVDRVARKFISAALQHLVEKSSFKWDDTLVRNHAFTRLANMAPVLVVYQAAGFMFPASMALRELVQDLSMLAMMVLAILLMCAVIDTFLERYDTYDVSREVPLKGFAQVLKLIIFLAAIVFAISQLTNKSPLVLIGGVGAMTAVIMLIFKDAILGFVAGIQLISNRMIARGDWIEMPSHGADGDVIDVSLTTVKVQNWDKTISTIPTYALISNSFKNWRGMSESGGRRIKRAVYIDINTIKFCDEAMLERFARIKYIGEYLASKRSEILEHNRAAAVDDASLVNGRRLTNVGTFRAYIVAYLKNHPMISDSMTFLVRQLEPGDNGLPIEIYVFCTDKDWANYEAIQSDIFDHILASVPEFDLRVFQHPSGRDFQSLQKA
ncbi:MAG: mechanosensitive ion channel [Verrucomicrobia bacterium]|nr:mechanosensitive ion channel [Verrucomicrobiota bacterium]